MDIENRTLIDDLLRRTQTSTEKVKRFEGLTIEQLRFKKDSQWSILECIEHLNLYGDFYLVEIEKRILENRGKGNLIRFKSGLLGNYFANLMDVSRGKVVKMKSPKDKNPKNSNLSNATISRFLKQQEHLIHLLNEARSVDLTRTKAAISLTKLIKLRLGDTLRFFIYHIDRHVLQAERICIEQEFPLGNVAPII